MLGDPSRIKHEAFCTTVTEEQMSRLLPEFGEFVLVKVTVVISPLKFYVRLPFGPKPFGNILKGNRHFKLESSVWSVPLLFLNS